MQPIEMRRVRVRISLFILLISLCLSSCDNRPYPRILLVADSLTYAHPDSAVTLLEQLKDSFATVSKRTRMYYQLLSIKAKDKAYVDHTSDSLILSIVSYYETKDDKKHLPEAYYYAGRVYDDLGDTPRALSYFQKAIEQSKGSTNYQFISLIHYQIGILFLDQDIFGNSLEAFKKAYQYAVLSKNDTYIVYNLREIGRVFTGQNNIDSTLYYYKKAEEVAENINNTYLVGIINQEMAGIYGQIEKYPEAYTAIQKSLCTSKRSIPAYYSTLANLFHKTGKTDSAMYYYTQLCSIGNYYHKQLGYKGLSKIARQQGKLSDALTFADNYHAYTDSINKTMNAEAVHKVNALYNYRLREKENKLLKAENKQRKQELIYILISFILLIAFIVIYIEQNKRKHLEQSKQKVLREKQYRKSVAFIKSNEEQIEQLTNELQVLQATNADQALLVEAQREELITVNKQIKAANRERELATVSLSRTPIYIRFHQATSHDIKLTKADWQALQEAIDHTYKDFTSRLYELYPVSEIELQICLLLKIGVSATNIASLTGRSKSGITSARKKLYEKIHGEKATPEQWDNFILSF